MFNVLVTSNGTAWETDQLMRILASRFNTHSGTEGNGISPAKPETLLRLEKVPSLLMYERGVRGPNTDVVRYAMWAESQSMEAI